MERFIYTISHDLRSPLVTVSGFLGLLKEDLESGDSQCAVNDLITISEAITKMDCLLLDTLELSPDRPGATRGGSTLRSDRSGGFEANWRSG